MSEEHVDDNLEDQIKSIMETRLPNAKNLNTSSQALAAYEKAAAEAQKAYEIQKEREAAALENQKQEEPAPQQPQQQPPEVNSSLGKPQNLVYVAYGYSEKTPQWALGLREILRDSGYLVFLPSEPVEPQFEEFELPSLLSLSPKLVQSMCRMLKVSENLILPINHQLVVQSLRAGDKGFDADSLLFKELYFLVRASLVICDLMTPNYTPEVVSKLHYCKLLDIPTIGISPGGQVMNPWVSKSVKVLLTDEFSASNILPLVRGYAENS